ncbi:FAD-binding domain-containing protein [Shigella flexneri]
MRQLNSTGRMQQQATDDYSQFSGEDFYRSTGAKASVFHVQLIDGDLAANNGGWQWAASNRTDAAPNSLFSTRQPRARNLISR